eukprot:m.513504 g.513504  ORF g.513504 m.513504 type:complete len:137 (+) comp21906_c1_seq4:204-614(+)
MQVTSSSTSSISPCITAPSDVDTLFAMQAISDTNQVTAPSVCVRVLQSLLGQIIVAGGTTLINGFTERLESELNGVLQPQTRFKILSSGLGQKSDRMFAAWVGGSILASLGTFQQLWVSRMEYDQLGKAVMEKKCP